MSGRGASIPRSLYHGLWKYWHVAKSVHDRRRIGPVDQRRYDEWQARVRAAGWTVGALLRAAEADQGYQVWLIWWEGFNERRVRILADDPASEVV
jgi:hypothetical protein